MLSRHFVQRRSADRRMLSSIRYAAEAAVDDGLRQRRALWGGAGSHFVTNRTSAACGRNIRFWWPSWPTPFGGIQHRFKPIESEYREYSGQRHKRKTGCKSAGPAADGGLGFRRSGEVW
jgi:hypothetical protein